VENDVNFMMAGVENAEEIKESYDAKVNSLEKDIQILRLKIDKNVNDYSVEKIQTSNMDLAFKRIINTLIKNNKNKKQPIMDEHITQFMKEITYKSNLNTRTSLPQMNT
jgi:hypothetical protein